MPVVSVVEAQELDLAGTVSDVYEITFTIPGRPGSFVFKVPRTGNVVEDAANAKAALEAEVQSLYAL